MSTRCSSARGPASAPSFVTWPTRTSAAPSALARATRLLAQPATCAIEPAGDPISGSLIAWMESTTTTSGARFAMACSIAGSWVASTTKTPGTSAPRRPARRRTWCAASSAATRRQRWPDDAIDANTCNSRVDLPVPGSPPRSVADPGSKPPESTRSSSPMPVGSGLYELRSTSPSSIGTGPSAVPALGWPAATSSSWSEFHSPQAGHRPDQRGAVASHALQRCTVRTLLIVTATYRRPVTRTRFLPPPNRRRRLRRRHSR